MSGRGRCTGHVPFKCSRLYPNCFAKVHISIPYEKEKSLTWRGWYLVPTTTKQICCMCVRLATSGAVEGTTLPHRNAEGRLFFCHRCSYFSCGRYTKGQATGRIRHEQQRTETGYRYLASTSRGGFPARVGRGGSQSLRPAGAEAVTCRSNRH